MRQPLGHFSLRQPLSQWDKHRTNKIQTLRQLKGKHGPVAHEDIKLFTKRLRKFIGNEFQEIKLFCSSKVTKIWSSLSLTLSEPYTLPQAELNDPHVLPQNELRWAKPSGS